MTAHPSVLNRSLNYLFSNPHFVMEYRFFAYIPRWLYPLLPPIKTFIFYYSWFRWIDNTIDTGEQTQQTALTFLQQRKAWLRQCYAQEKVTPTFPEDDFIWEVIRKDKQKGWGLQRHFEGILEYLELDIKWRGTIRTQSQLEQDLVEIGHAFDAMLRIFGIRRTLSDDAFTQFIWAREVFYNLWDLETDLRLGFIYIPKHVWSEAEISPREGMNQPEQTSQHPRILRWKQEEFFNAQQIFLNLLQGEIHTLPLKERLLFRFSITGTMKRIGSKLKRMLG